jgi:predicted Zn-dependent protease
MRAHFEHIVDAASSLLTGREIFTAWFSGEETDFCRLNHSRVRQAGTVRQMHLSFRLIRDQRSAEATLTLSGIAAEDVSRIAHAVARLRDVLDVVPDDPFLLYNTDVHSTEQVGRNALPDATSTLTDIMQRSRDIDLVGIWASGPVQRGFANSLGQRNWFSAHSFNFDYSVYLEADKACKGGYAGTEWKSDAFLARLASTRAQLDILARPPRALSAGGYRAYLAPAALLEITDVLAWGGFGLKSAKTKQSPTQRLFDAGDSLSSVVTMRENTADGLAPNFNSAGFVKPSHIDLVTRGCYAASLISPRSAREFGVATNGADDGEAPASLDMDPGSLSAESACEALGTGIYLNNLWYLNFSDRLRGRITGMTRFASFWVEGGRFVAPLSAMRFDDSMYRFLGTNLLGVTRERELLVSSSTYGQRAVTSARLPGILVDDFRLTL